MGPAESSAIYTTSFMCRKRGAFSKTADQSQSCRRREPAPSFTDMRVMAIGKQLARGSIYGNIQFTFDWNKIIRGRNIYWVEAIEYGVHAYRLLLTDRTLKEGKLAQPYDLRVMMAP